MRRLIVLLAAGLAVSAYGQSGNPQMDIANLREDVRGLIQKVDELSLKVEQLERENVDLRAKSATADKSLASLKELESQIAEVNAATKSAVASSKADTLQQVTAMIEKLARQTNAAIDSLAKGMATRPPVQTNFTENYPKDGISYTVQAGDNLASIAKKTGAKQQDIINANKIQDASKIQVGQTLFVPGGK